MDDLDSLLFLEDHFVREGLQRGRHDAQRQGFEEGKQLGELKAREIFSEVGFYRGCVCTWLAMHEAGIVQPPFSDVSVKRMHKILNIIMSIRVGDPHDDRLPQLMQSLRAQFKLLTINLKFHDSFVRENSTNSLNF